MNLFVVHSDPEKAARMLCDQHVRKMIVESAQMLCTAHWETGGSAPYKRTHQNTSIAKWARSTFANYQWIVANFI